MSHFPLTPPRSPSLIVQSPHKLTSPALDNTLEQYQSSPDQYLSIAQASLLPEYLVFAGNIHKAQNCLQHIKRNKLLKIGNQNPSNNDQYSPLPTLVSPERHYSKNTPSSFGSKRESQNR